MQHKRRLEHRDDGAVQDAVIQQFRSGPQQNSRGAQHQQGNHRKDHAQHRSGADQHGKQLIGALFVAGAQRHGNQSAAAGAQHKADAAKCL